MFILKEVKVICFHTLLQVLILKVVAAVLCDPSQDAFGTSPSMLGVNKSPSSRRVDWICLILKDLIFLVATKNPQENEGKGDSWWREMGIASKSWERVP